MKQAQSVEISYLMSGGVVSQRRLSRRGEWRAGIAAFALVAGMSLAGALLVGAALLAAHRVVYALPYAVVWMLAGARRRDRRGDSRRGPGPFATPSARTSTTMPLPVRRCRWYAGRRPDT